MTKKLKFRNILIICFFLGFLCVTFIIYTSYSNKADDYLNNLYSKYPPISFSKEYCGKVLDIIKPNERIVRNSTSSSLVFLDDSSTTSIFASKEVNLGYTLEAVIALGDSIYKKANSDTLFIIKKRSQDIIIYKYLIY